MYCIGKVIRHLFATVASTDTKMRFLILAICLHVSILLSAKLFLSYLGGNVTENVICPDGTSECPNRYRCCELQPEGCDCCPLENAVYCPDNETQCSSGNTCCRLSSGGWGCCPLANTGCCNDLPCCKEGYTCRPGDCRSDSLSVSVSNRFLSVSKSTTYEDKQTVRTDSEICCKGSSDNNSRYACCPDKDAVCCSDGKSCCPKGYICDVRDKTCAKPSELSLKKIFAVEKNLLKFPLFKPQTCPGGRPICKSTDTCCKRTGGLYYCCHFPNAKCCGDDPCVPQGHSCPHANYQNGYRLSTGDSVIPMLKKLPSKLTAAVKVICPDRGQCDDNATYCPNSTSGNGCCSQPNTVCCSDHTHCCPEGYTCQTSGSCVLEDSVIAMTQNFPAAADQSDVVCSDTNTATCDRDNTALPSIEHQVLHLPP